MKKIICIAFLISLVFSCAINHQKGNANNDNKKLIKLRKDTLAYLKTFENQKINYIGKPLKNIFSDVGLPLKSYFLGQGRTINTINAISISVYTQRELSEKMDNRQAPMIIIITLNETIPYDGIIKDIDKKDKGEWTTTVSDYFGKLIVKDINVNNH